MTVLDLISRVHLTSFFLPG